MMCICITVKPVIAMVKPQLSKTLENRVAHKSEKLEKVHFFLKSVFNYSDSNQTLIEQSLL